MSGYLFDMARNDEPDIRVPFGRDTAAPAAVRALLAERLDPEDPAAYDIMLAASELVTNAVIHTTSGGAFRFWRSDERVRIEVEDFDPRPPTPAPADEPVGGFGLRIVAAMSLGWGSEETVDGKVVWAEFFVRPVTRPTSNGAAPRDHRRDHADVDTRDTDSSNSDVSSSRRRTPS